MRTLLLLLAATLLPVSVSAQAPDPGDAYIDASARELVRLARHRRAMVDHRIQAYEATAVERISIGLRAGIGERVLYRRESASLINWTRDTVRIEVKGAREVLPPFSGLPQVPGDLSGYMPSMAFDPVDSEMLLRLDSTTLRHPLSAGSEGYYRFSTGDSTVIRLPDGRTVRLRELRIQPRRNDPQLISGSFWLETETHAVVQAYFRPARNYDSRRDPDASDLGPQVRAQLDFIALDYGLWDLRWWLPRSVAAEGMAQVGAFRMPMVFERRYQGYTVLGDTLGLPVIAGDDAAEARPCRPRVSFTIQARVGEPDTAAQARQSILQARRDSVRTAQRDSLRAAGGDSTNVRTLCERPFIVTQPEDAELLASDLLPGDLFSGERLIDDEQLRRIAERLQTIPKPPWSLERPTLRWGLAALGMTRYNRVEGLSFGALAGMGLGGANLELEGRVGTTGEFGGRVSLSREGDRVRSGVAAYRRLDTVDVSSSPFSFGHSLSALLVGRDDNDYFRASGAEFTLRPPVMQRQWYELRLFGERQEAVGARSKHSLPRLFDSDRSFRDNIEADAADQLGARLTLRAAYGANPRLPRWGAELDVLGETGDFEFIRPAGRVRMTTPLGQRFAAGFEVGGGTAFGDTPTQRLWQLGGAATLRGFSAGAQRGDTFWRGRAEIGTGTPLVRATVFGDVGWAGPRDQLELSRPLRSAGFGLSLLDGLARVDLARGVETRRWRLHLQLDGVL